MDRIMMPNKDTIISTIKDLPLSARSVERSIAEMYTFSKLLYSLQCGCGSDINDIPPLLM